MGKDIGAQPISGVLVPQVAECRVLNAKQSRVDSFETVPTLYAESQRLVTVALL